MIITKLRLVKYQRIRLNLIDLFEYTPTAPTQFIIGTNGSGKSSLMAELSPLPADRVEYAKGGSKEIWLTYNGASYQLKSDFTDGQHHSFIRNHLELNEGGTVTVQKELVLQHFHYTNEIHQLVIGAKRFHAMSLSERKHWFTMLSDANYDYAIGVFNKVKDRLRDTVGALKLAKKRLVIESAKIMPQDEFDRLKTDCDELYEQVQFLIEHRLAPQADINQLLNTNAQAIAQIERDSQLLVKRLKTIRKQYPTNEEAIQAIQLEIQDRIAGCKALSQEYFSEHEIVQKLYDAWHATRLESLAEIDKEISTAEEEITAAKKASILGLEQTAPAQVVLASCDAIEAWLPSVQDGLSDNRERQWGRASYALVLEEIEKLQQLINTERNKAARAQQIAEHQRAHKDDEEVSCPKCNHHFRLSFNALILQDAQVAHASALTATEVLMAELAKKIELKDQMGEYFQNYKNFLSTLRATAGLTGFCDHLIASEVILNQPTKIGLLLSHLKRDAGRWAIIEGAQERINGAQKLLEQTGGINSSSQEITARKERLEASVVENSNSQRSFELELDQLVRHTRELKGIAELQTSLALLGKQAKDLYSEASETLRREVYGEFLRHVQTILAGKEQALRASERQQSVINAVTEEIHALTDDETALKLLTKELSPTEGLIAEGLFGFMKAFIDEMNKVIKLIWTYPLVVKPCALESESTLSLTYKFPMEVGGKDTVRADVVQGSDGMKEVIDLAFRIAAMKALKIGDFPLFLDEFGKALDPTHKQATIGLINAIVELDAFEQLFMISHDVVQYGSLGRAEICVLHESNVTLPPNCVYNKHVIMK